MSEHGSFVGKQRFYCLAFLASISIIFVLSYQPFYNAVVIWIGNDIYNHCLLVLPASLYFIWEKRKQLKATDTRPSWLALIALVLQLCLYTLGTAADIQLFQHAAIFSMLPTIIWLFIGNNLAWQIKFPLIFMLFAIPVGEELIPFLQEITADISVEMLKWTGVPLFRSGLFIEIPKGKFLVAEACSGVSFLIASIVIGNLYAYMNLITWPYRIAFVVLSVVFPIIANALRVYGIILIAHLSDMKHAVGADHIIYGWFFFAFVLVCLLGIGELIRKIERRKHKREAPPETEKSALITARVEARPVLLVALFASLLLFLFQDYRMQHAQAPQLTDTKLKLPQSTFTPVDRSINWQPQFVNAYNEQLKTYSTQNGNIHLYKAVFAGDKGEVVSSMNKIYRQENWTLVKRRKVDIDNSTVIEEIIAGPGGEQMLLYYWYVMDSQILSGSAQVKLMQAWLKLQGLKPPSAFVALAIELKDGNEPDAVYQTLSEEIKTVTEASKNVLTEPALEDL
uniref:exosortase A n=1 Tax=Ningiella ruwaisensis TaxID=2364274 RepID=UPI0010A05ACA|nr:exosortase A [Ningiella ruwaisensis]